MTKGVNLLQNPIEYDKYVNDYLLQALANLGQRVGIKGDSIAYKYFTFNDILKSETIYSNDNFLGYIQYKEYENNKYKAELGVCSINKETDIQKEDNRRPYFQTLNVNNILYFPNELSFDIPLGSVEKYAKNSICINDGTDFTFMLAGKIIGDDDNNKLNTILYYYKFDIASNKLKFGVKIRYDHTDSKGDDWFQMITTYNDEYKNNGYSNSILGSTYTMSIYIFNASKLKNIDEESSESQYANSVYANQYYESFIDAFRFSTYKKTNESNNYSIIRPEYEDINQLLYYDNDYYLKFSNNSVVSIINNFISTYLNNKDNNKNKYDIKLGYNTNTNEFYSLYDDTYENTYEHIREIIKNEYNIDLGEQLLYLREDCTQLYYNIFNYYNEKYFFESKSTFFTRILLKLYEKIAKENFSSLSSNPNKFILYIPLNYQFNYICNSNNIYIYYSNNIYITYADLNKVNKLRFWTNNTNLVYDYDIELSKVKVYNFEIYYNKDNESIINYINIKDIYTMPYINANDNWSVNDVDSKVQAVGKDAGNPNIIIIHSKQYPNIEENIMDDNGNEYSLYETDNFEILNTISNIDIVNASRYSDETFFINPVMFDNVNNNESLKCHAYIPIIDQNNFEYFKNSIILSISDLNCLENEVSRENFRGSYIFSIWHLSKIDDTNNIEFDYKYDFVKENIGAEQPYALSFQSGINILKEMNDSDVANLNSQDILLLKAIVRELGHEHLTTESNNWLVFRNKIAEEYAEYINEQRRELYTLNNDTYNINNNEKESIYNNDLNGIIEFTDNARINDNNHVVYSQNKKYIRLSNINEIDLTNVLYPKYEINKTERDAAVIATVDELRSFVNDNPDENDVHGDYITRIYVGNKEVTNIDSYIEELRRERLIIGNYLNMGHISIVKEIITTNVTGYYNDYSFNSNVPSLDLKEVFVRNTNVLNRLNIITPIEHINGSQKTLEMYNAYIGTSYDESEKSTLHIGTNETNINVGTDSLMSVEMRNKFKAHNKLSLDFKNIEFQKDANIILNNNKVFNTITISEQQFNTFNASIIGTKYVPGENNNDAIFYPYDDTTDIVKFSDFGLSEYKLHLSKFLLKNLNYSIGNSDFLTIHNVKELSKSYGDDKSGFIIQQDQVLYPNSWTMNPNKTLDDELYYYVYEQNNNKTYYILFNENKLKNKLLDLNLNNIIYSLFTMNVLCYTCSPNNNNNVYNVCLSIN